VFFITETSKHPWFTDRETSAPRSIGSRTRVQAWVLSSRLPAPPLLHTPLLCTLPASWLQDSAGRGWWQMQEHPRSHPALCGCCGTPEPDPSATATQWGSFARKHPRQVCHITLSIIQGTRSYSNIPIKPVHTP